MWMRIWTGVTAALGLWALSGCDREENRGGAGSRRDPANPDHAFLITAARSNLAEVAAGRLAMERGTDPEVKQYGNHMVEDHARANEELAELARKKGVAMPDQPGDSQKKAEADLAKLSGADFDRAYAGMMINDHVKAVALFEDEAKQAQDADVRAFAEKNAPKLREHLRMARDLNTRLKSAP